MCVSNSARRLAPGPVSNPEFSQLLSEVDKWSKSSKKKKKESSPTKDKKKTHRVVHDYHDHLTDSEKAAKDAVAKGGVMTPFPVKLHQVLESVEKDGLGDVISWQPHGRCFIVRKPDIFISRVMPAYFNQTKIASFQRQLNLYGFQRLTRGPDKGSYYHERFLRGKVWLSRSILRKKVKGTRVRAKSSPASEPDFYTMPSVVVSEDNHSAAEEDHSSQKSQGRQEKPAALISPHASPMPTPSSAPLLPPPSFVLQSHPPPSQVHNDDILYFEGKPFHYLEHPHGSNMGVVPFHPEEVRGTDEDDDRDLHDLFERLVRPTVSSSFETDESFGELLETILQQDL